MWSEMRLRYQSIDKILRHYARLDCSTKPIRLGTAVLYGTAGRMPRIEDGIETWVSRM